MKGKEVFSIFALSSLVLMVFVAVLQVPVSVESLSYTGRAISISTGEVGSVSVDSASSSGESSSGSAGTSSSTGTSGDTSNSGSTSTTSGTNNGGKTSAGGSISSSGKQVASTGVAGASSSETGTVSVQGSSTSTRTGGSTTSSRSTTASSSGDASNSGSGSGVLQLPESTTQFSLKSSLAGRTPQVQAAVLQVVSENGLSDPQVSSTTDGKTKVTATRTGKLFGVVPVRVPVQVEVAGDGETSTQEALWAAIFSRFIR